MPADSAKRRLLKFAALTVLVDLLPACGGGGSAGGTASTSEPPPTITAQPASVSVTEPAVATFSVVATGGTPTYQWQSSTDGGTTFADIPGATGASYTTAATSAATDNGERLRVVVATAGGQVDSTVVTLTVLAAGGIGTAGLSVLAGNVYGPGADGTGVAGTFYYPTGPAVDSAGNVYLADSRNQTIRRITAAGVVTTVAGAFMEEGNGDGIGANASFFAPAGVAVAADRTLYVSDSGNNLIRKIAPGGAVTTLAGSGARGGADGTGAAASFFGPSALVVDAGGNVFVADPGNNAIRKIAPGGVVTTFAGSAAQGGSADGVGTAARFQNPQAIAIDGTGSLYVGDYLNHTIRRITPAGVVTTIAGTAGLQGGTDGPAASATFSYPIAVAVDPAGNVYVGDGLTSRVRRITPDGIVSTVVSAGIGTTPSDFTVNGLAVDSAGNLTVTNGQNDTVLSLTPAGVVTTLAGSAGANGGRQNGVGIAARFYFPAAVAADGNGVIWVSDTANDTVRKISAAGVVSDVAGAPPTTDVPYYLNAVVREIGNTPIGSYASGTGSSDGTGNAAAFSYPLGIVSDGAGTLYVADSNNSTVRQVAPGGVVTTLAGTAGVWGTVDGTGSAARFYAPAGVARDSAGVLYVTDYNDHVVRRISPEGVVTTLAGRAGAIGSADGTGAAATFAFPTGIAVDGSGTLYVVDTGNSIIRTITPAGVVGTLAGLARVVGTADGAGAVARFRSPTGIALGASGNLYVSDTNNHTIRQVTPAGVVTTVVGVAGSGAFVAGALPGGLREPAGLTISGGTLYVATMNGVAMVAGLG
jgi:sugar lactone lactonase YvrE